MRRRIEEEYNDYARRVISKDAGHVQRKETRQAFFAGALSALVAIEKSATDKDITIMSDLMAEMEAFAEATVRAGGRHA